MTRKRREVTLPRVLVVDDDDVLRRWIRAQLESRGFEIQEEANGDDAFSAYECHGPWDFVLSDLYFYPGERIKNGLDLVREILVMNGEQRLAIHTSERDLKAPCRVLHKPYGIGELLRLLREPVTKPDLPLE